MCEKNATAIRQSGLGDVFYMQIQLRLNIRENIVWYIGKLPRNEFSTKFNSSGNKMVRKAFAFIYLTLNDVLFPGCNANGMKFYIDRN